MILEVSWTTFEYLWTLTTIHGHNSWLVCEVTLKTCTLQKTLGCSPWISPRTHPKTGYHDHSRAMA